MFPHLPSFIYGVHRHEHLTSRFDKDRTLVLTLARLALTMVGLLADVTGLLAQEMPATVPRVVIKGAVWDSLSGTPLQGAVVQFVATGDTLRIHSAVADSLGLFEIPNLHPGRYVAGFFHPLLDSLGIVADTHLVHAVGLTTHYVRLATPSPERIRELLCDPTPHEQSSVLIVGKVREATSGSAVAGASIAVRWLELSLSRGGAQSRIGHTSVTTDDSGGFVLCAIPRGTLEVVAKRGVDSTDVLELRYENPFLRKDFYLVARTDTASLQSLTSLRGVVLDSSGAPLQGVHIVVGATQATRTDALGHWRIDGVHLGTRMLIARAIGFEPVRLLIDATQNSQPVQLRMSRAVPVLDRVTVSGSMSALRMRDFDSRRRSLGIGRFIDAAAIQRAGATAMSDILRNLPGVHWVNDTVGVTTKLLRMKGPFGDCDPEVYVNGHLLGSPMTNHVFDILAVPRMTLGVEVYTSATVPPQYQKAQALVPCGAIAVWTK